MNNLIVDLIDDELKKSFKNELITALNNIKNPCAKITIKFTDNNGIISEEKIEIILNSIYFKKVNLSSLGNEKAIDLIVNNLHYNYFKHVETKIKIGKTKCHGWNEYWGTDTVIIHYHRFNEF